MSVNIPQWPGWHLIGSFESDVGSWILHHGGEAMLLEVPEGLPVGAVQKALKQLGSPRLKYTTASHLHEDHFDAETWEQLRRAFPETDFLRPGWVARSFGECRLHLGNEPLWFVQAPKHSRWDTVTIFRGVAMMGDIELGMLESVNDEVPERTRRQSMRRLAGFCERTGYHVHTIVSAHLNDVRINVDWPALFSFSPTAICE